MPILALAARHHQVGLENLERLSARPCAVRRAVVSACVGVRGAVVLETCNRFELYLDVEHLEIDVRDVTRTVARVLGLPAVLVAATLTRVADPVAHLCEVAAGLDSMVLGEQEIAGQVRRAVAESRAAGMSSGPLERLFGAASRAARQVATGTGLGSLGRSVVDVALDAAGVAPGARCVLVGTGSYAGAAVAALTRRGVATVEVYSPTGRAAEFAEPRGLGVIDAEGLAAAVTGADLVVTCSGGGGVVLRPEHFASAGSAPLRTDRPLAVVGPASPRAAEPLAAVGLASPHAAEPDAVSPASPRAAEPDAVGPGSRDFDRPLVVVDLALRRDVDPAVGDLPHVRLVALRDLAELAPGLGSDDVARARALVAATVAEFSGEDRAIAWGRDLAVARRRALAAHPATDRRRVHALLHPASALAHAAARAGDRHGFEAALARLAAASSAAALANA